MVDSDCIRQQAWAAHRANELHQAETYYRQLLAEDPDPRDAINLGALLRSSGRLSEAAAHYQRALTRWPADRMLRLNAANCARELGQARAALGLVAPLLAANPDDLAGLESRAKSELALGELPTCRQTLELLLRLQPDHKEALTDLGICLSRAGQPRQGLARLEQAQRLDPDDLRLCGLRLTLLVELGDLTGADGLLSSLKLPGNPPPELLNGQAVLLMARQDHAAALPLLEQLSQAEPQQAGHWLNRAACLRGLKHLVAAHRVVQHGLKLHPGHRDLNHALVQSLAERGQQQRALPLLRELIDNGKASKAQELFNLQFLGAGYGLLSSAERQQLARRWEQQQRRLGPLWPDLMLEPLQGRRLRVGYLSADFCNHPVGRFLLPVLQHHDRDAVEVWGLSCGPHNDWITKRLQQQCEHWMDLQAFNDQQAARLVADQRLDVLVELGGFTGASRLGIVAERPAPVQLSYLGFPGPTYLQAIDGWLGDAVLFSRLDAIDRAAHRLVELQGGYMAFAPGELPLPQRGTAKAFRFGSFNHARKLTAPTLDLWMPLLRAVPEAQLVLKSISFVEPAEQRRIRQLFERAGLAAERLELLPWVEGGLNHLQRYQEVDVALDPVPYGGATTTAEALWMGVPVVSLAGRGMVGCLSASVLAHAGCGGWIAHDAEAFVAIGQHLAALGARSAQQRLGLRQQVQSSALANGRRLARALEQAYAGLSRQRPAC